MNQINFKRIIEEAYEGGVSELLWDLSGYGSFKSVRYPNAVIFLTKSIGFLGAIYTDDINYSTRRFTSYLTQKMSLKYGEHKVSVSYLEGYSVKESFSFHGEIPKCNLYLQLMFKPIKKLYLENTVK